MAVAEERESRSVALETAYVHDVYDQISTHFYPSSCSCSSIHGSECGDEGGNCSRVWPRVKQFIQNLEPGALVCDVGCGIGKYLHVNPDVFKIGADRCIHLTELAREKELEVMVCDNLALPFRDDSFDAVLSVAVLHHFATTERRVNALRELARVLRIGGRLLISVWAMEQRYRKFESQDVLVPWHRPQQKQHLSTPSLELASTATTATTTSEEWDVTCQPPYHAYTQTSDSDSARSNRATNLQPQRKRGRSRHKGRSIDPARPISSPSSSELSSPNETCYSFVRRALQKLAGGRRGRSRQRAWFLDSWGSSTKDSVNAMNATSDMATDFVPDAELGDMCDSQYDVANLPIELRRLEDVEPGVRAPTNTLSPSQERTIKSWPLQSDIVPLKSQSLGDIMDTARPKLLVRSCSSAARLPVTTEKTPIPPSNTASTRPHPTLVRQKHSLCEDDEEVEARDCPGPAPTRLADLVLNLPEVGGHRRGVPKQRSLNDELMSSQRQREKARVRQNITKQASLNEQLLGDGRQGMTLGSIKESFLASPRFQQFRSGLNKLTTISASPTDATKVAGHSFKNGFVRMLQSWKSEPTPEMSEMSYDPPIQSPPPVPTTPTQKKSSESPSSAAGLQAPRRCERRLSREEGSDSSKDSSLQSDTSVDSEDSFASVIFVPKTQPKIDNPTPETTAAVTTNPVADEIEKNKENNNVTKIEVPVIQQSTINNTTTVRTDTLNRIQQLLQERTTNEFPLIRRSTPSPRMNLTRPIPKLLSLELFNPETDDLDSDSSGMSTPDSVISVKDPTTKSPISLHLSPATTVLDNTETQKSNATLLEAAANVATSLEDAVDVVIQSSPRAKRKIAFRGFHSSPSPPPVPPRPWDEDCRQHLTDFAEKLSEKLLKEIDRYSEICNTSSTTTPRNNQSLRTKLNRNCFESKQHCDNTQGKLDHVRYLKDLQEINSDIGSQLIKLHEELDSLPFNLSTKETGNKSNLTTELAAQNNENSEKEKPCSIIPSSHQISDTKMSSQSDKIDIKSTKNKMRVSQDPPTRQVSWEDKLIVSNDLQKDFNEKKKSQSVDNSCIKLTDLDNTVPVEITKSINCISSISGSTSQDSLQSSAGSSVGAGGAITYHRYYHVFKEGELDSLIERYVENLHIISSYYDHANWCIIAEKVHVWTI